MALQDVSQALWTERELLERLLFKLEEERALIERGDQRWISWCIDEIRSVVQHLQEAEAARQVAFESVADELGIDPGASLRELIGSVAYPWDTILSEHQRALGGVARELAHCASTDRDRLDECGASDVATNLHWVRPSAA